MWKEFSEESTNLDVIRSKNQHRNNYFMHLLLNLVIIKKKKKKKKLGEDDTKSKLYCHKHQTKTTLSRMTNKTAVPVSIAQN